MSCSVPTVSAGRSFLKVSRIVALVLVLVGLSVVFPDSSKRLRRADASSIGAPTSVIALAGSQHVAVSWTAPSSDGGSALTDYIIEYSSDSGTNWTTFADGTSTATSATITGLSNSATYIVRVSAVNSTGTSSPSSNSSSVAPGTTLSFETVTNSMVTLGSLATRSACAPLTKQGVGPYTYSGVDSNGEEYSYVTDRSESGNTLRQSRVSANNSVTFSSSTSASLEGRTNKISLSSSGNIPSGNSCSYNGATVTTYGSIFGPQVYTAPFSATYGQAVSVDWAAAGGGDDFEVYAFLVKVADAPVASYGYGSNSDQTLLLYNRGRTKSWSTASQSVPSSGLYRFRFVNGTYDYSGGLFLGATMYIDPSARVGDANNITFDALADRVKDSSAQTFSVAASASSGEPVTFTSSTTSICTVGSSSTSSGTSTATLTILANATGLCTLTSNSASTDQYATAQSVVRSFTVRASATVPSNSGGTGHTGTLTVDSTLTAVQGSWADGGATITNTAHQWQSSANGSSGWTDITSATGSTYVLSSDDLSKFVRVAVTKTNSVGSTTASGIASTVIGASTTTTTTTTTIPQTVSATTTTTTIPTSTTTTTIPTSTTTTTIPPKVTSPTTVPSKPRVSIPGIPPPITVTILQPVSADKQIAIVSAVTREYITEGDRQTASKIRNAVIAAAPATTKAISNANENLVKVLEDKSSTQLQIVKAKSVVADASAQTILTILQATNGNITSFALPMTDKSVLPDVEPGFATILTQQGSSSVRIKVVNDSTVVLTSKQENLSLAVSAVTSDGGLAPINSRGAVRVAQGMSLAVTGSGFKPNSKVALWMFSSPRSFGFVLTDSSGSFAAEVPMPGDIIPGDHTVQINGRHANGGTRSLNLGVEMSLKQAPTKYTARVVTRIQFDRQSVLLTPETQRQLSLIAKKIENKSGVVVKCTGYTQGGLVGSFYNLAQRRADAVCQRLRQLGVNAKFEAVGVGPAKQATELARRVTITLVY